MRTKLRLRGKEKVFPVPSSFMLTKNRVEKDKEITSLSENVLLKENRFECQFIRILNFLYMIGIERLSYNE